MELLADHPHVKLSGGVLEFRAHQLVRDLLLGPGYLVCGPAIASVSLDLEAARQTGFLCIHVVAHAQGPFKYL